MVTVASVAIALGSFLLMASAIFAVLGWGSHRQRRRLERTPRRTCAELLHSPTRRCLVVGEIAAGPQGLQVAPICDVGVAWYRTRVWLWSQPRSTSDDAETLVWEQAAVGPVSLRDETGSVLVSMSLFDTERADARSAGDCVQTIVDSYADPPLRQLTERGLLPPGALRDARKRSTQGYRVQELVLRPGQPLSVLAAPRLRNGRLVLERPRMGRSLVSSRTPEDLLADHREDAGIGFVGALWALGIGGTVLLIGVLLALALPGEAVLGWRG